MDYKSLILIIIKKCGRRVSCSTITCTKKVNLFWHAKNFQFLSDSWHHRNYVQNPTTKKKHVEEGFRTPVGTKPLDFESNPFDHSGTSTKEYNL